MRRGVPDGRQSEDGTLSQRQSLPICQAMTCVPNSRSVQGEGAAAGDQIIPNAPRSSEQ